jgi:tryptophan-rich sensory protein
MDKRNWLQLISAIAVCEIAGMLGSVFTLPAISGWYAGLMRPAFSPPNWIFGPVWTTLFALMGIAAFLVWQKGWKQRMVRTALWIFAVQLVLNVAWSFIFFGQHNPGGAFIDIVLLWIAILATIIVFNRLSKPAAWLLLPYIAWVSFAGYLNYSIWQLNSLPTAASFPTPQVSALPSPSAFSYPQTLGTTYIHPVDWPPKVQVLAKSFTCTTAGSEIERAGRTEQATINGRAYCVTKESEGAAGSIYTNYAYAFAAGNNTVILTFSLQAVQCANYDDPQKSACEKERAIFDVSPVIDQIASSLRLP